MTAQYFVDTNVLVYFRDTSDSAKHVRAYEWLDELTRTANATTSFQVLNEFYDVVTRRRRIGMTPEAARADVRDYLAIWEPMPVTEQVIERAWATQDTFGFS
ncbi:MAG: PIN domain-containing protein, partial [Dehalococcoidia bacterium]